MVLGGAGRVSAATLVERLVIADPCGPLTRAWFRRWFVVFTRYGPFPAVPVLAAILIRSRRFPIAVRRYRPLAVLAITVSAETVLLMFSPEPRSRSA